ncbi:MAG: hypothetical protein K0R50_1053 [Eubacterium sp.]|nr:hypothetical protein [Eubacterium sp.]
MSHIKKNLFPIFLSLVLIFVSFPFQTISAKASDYIAFIVLTKYSENVDIGAEFNIAAITSTGKLPTWKSSNSSLASVNTYGKVTAKKAGTVTITAKIKNAEASCRVTINKTRITISKTSASIERGEILKLTAATSNNSQVTWKSSKKSIAEIDENGVITGIKPGETTITASVQGSSATCKIKVKAPTISLNLSTVTLYRGQKNQLKASVSSGILPAWKSNKKSVAVVDDSGSITAVKHGTAVISATVDGVSKSCKVVVEIPTIKLSALELNLKQGTASTISASISSGNPPVWTSSNPKVATVDSTGRITAVKKGTAYIYASEDGAKERCIIHVSE